MLCINRKIVLTCLGAMAVSPALAVELSTVGDTRFAIGGYVKAQGIFSNPDDGKSTFDATASESRMNFRSDSTVNGQEVTAFIEGDFYGSNATGSSSELRLRQAWVKVGNLTMGQAWSGYTQGIIAYDVVDIWGGGRGDLSGGNFRPTLVRYESHGFSVSMQDPVYESASFPDTTVTYTQNFEGGHILKGTVATREIENDDVAVGFSMAAKVMLGRNDIRVNAHYGEGLGAYSLVGVNDALAGDVENGDAVSQYGYRVGYRHFFTERLRGNVVHSRTELDDDNETLYKSTHVNLLYRLLPNMDVGVEWREYNLSLAALRPQGEQVEVMAKYFF